uniref:Uncharacterized protein n=1 Tax=Anguilla anguilla TaxID=7936 RepID=A0A0E9R1J3_ANGAN
MWPPLISTKQQLQAHRSLQRGIFGPGHTNDS